MTSKFWRYLARFHSIHVFKQAKPGGSRIKDTMAEAGKTTTVCGFPARSQELYPAGVLGGDMLCCLFEGCEMVISNKGKGEHC